MSYKMKYRFFHVLFQLFAYLADQTGGWKMFVRPKLLLGSIIIALGTTACGQNSVKPQNSIKREETKTDSIIKINKDSLNTKQDSIQHDPAVFCYHVEVFPKFPGGDSALIKWLSENVYYPKEGADDVQGRVICRFVVEKDGSISDVEVVRGLEPAFDTVAVSIIKSMPKWIPGTQNGKAVRVYYSLPITFRLSK